MEEKTLSKEKIEEIRDLIFRGRNLEHHLSNLMDLLEMVVKSEDWRSKEMLSIVLHDTKEIAYLMRKTQESLEKIEEWLNDFLLNIT